MSGLRATARVTLTAGAISSIYFMLRVGRVQVLLNVVTRATLYALMLTIAIVSPAIYGNVALGPPRPQPAFWFLIVPFASCLLLAIAIPFATFVSARKN